MTRPFLCLDPGHGGRDPGAENKLLGLRESELNLFVAARAHDIMRHSYGRNVILTRASDTFVELQERARLSNASDSQIFVSVHINSAEQEAEGFEVWHYPDRSVELAKNVLGFLEKAMPRSTNRGLKSSSKIVVTQKTLCPAVLVELGFINDPWFSKVITMANTQNALAWALCQATVKTVLESVRTQKEKETRNDIRRPD